MRSARGAAAVLAAACVLWAGGAAPAFAADSLSLTSPAELTLPLGPEGGSVPAKTLSVKLHHSDWQHPAEGRLVFDTTDLAGVADVAWPAACTPAAGGGGATCDAPTDTGTSDGTIVLSLTPAHGSGDGTSGALRYTGSGAAGLAEVHGQTKVTVRSQPDIFLSGVPQRMTAKPGDTLALPFALTNRGGEPGPGSILQIIPTLGLDVVGRHSNCEYEESGTAGRPHAKWILCVLDPVEAGATASYGKGLSFVAGPDSLIEDAEFDLSPYSQARLDQMRKGHSMTPGTGPAMAPEKAGATTQAWPYSGDDWADAKITVDNIADFSLATANLKGARGAVVTAKVDMTNNGPAGYADNWNERSAARIDFRPPPGTTVVKASEFCDAFDKNGKRLGYGVPGVLYTCKQRYYFLAGATATESFGLRIDKVIPNATGSATIAPESVTPYDKNPANNTVKIVLNASAGGGTSGAASGGGQTGGAGGSTAGGTTTGGSASGTTGGSSATGGTSGTSGSSGGDLAATGGGPVALIGEIALGCGLLGGALLLVLRSRRRRTAA
ncbi:hypothetical protein [Streptomyces sp. NPDC049040]|uniref:hypothetical protein n=1 Tax=Streptomyces sp. NPDC049040 TaxID=3365593 RepID=UPI0037243123